MSICEGMVLDQVGLIMLKMLEWTSDGLINIIL